MRYIFLSLKKIKNYILSQNLWKSDLRLWIDRFFRFIAPIALVACGWNGALLR